MEKIIKQEVVFDRSPKEIFSLLTSSEGFTEMTGAPADLSDTTEEAFSCFGDRITGRNVEMIPNKLIVQEWRVFNWEDGLHSQVRFELNDHEDGTLLVMEQTGHPEAEHDHLAAGWHNMYWEKMKNYFAGK